MYADQLFNHSTIRQPGENNTCSYTTYQWNIRLKKAVKFRRVTHAYSSLSENEINTETGCTVCQQDQMVLKIKGLPAIRVCKRLAPKIRYILSRAQHEGFVFKTITAYRVGMTKGEVDKEGNRTEFSNHSFGIAIDINAEQNGLYDHCIQFSKKCRLRKGGKWQPGVTGTLTKSSILVKLMEENGFKWGGKIKGRQKDFMHFSPTGY